MIDGARRSVFVQLVAILVTMAVCLMSLVGGFFLAIVRPNLDASVDRVFGEYARLLAATSLDAATARGLAERLQIQVRYEGPGGGGGWSTAADLPTLAAARAAGRSLDPWGRDYRVVAAPDGGSYLLVWELRRPMQEAHTKMVALLLALMVAVFFVAHHVLRRALRPLRALQEGVARLSEGNLDVVVEARTRDEFGALTEAFNRMVARVREMVQARDRLLLDVSHELRSPLTRMKVALELLPQEEKTQRLRADVREMEAMITELLELERLRCGRGLELRRQDLVPLVREVAAAFAGQAPGVVVTAAPAAGAWVACDEERVRTVLRNLLENAIKYSLPDSRPVEVSIAAEAGTAGAGAGAGAGAAGRVVVRVADDGPGIPAADLDRLFEPFFRVDRSRSKATGGYGLGLSLCRRIMAAHGGSIGAENRAGRGACFVAGFPGA